MGIARTVLHSLQWLLYSNNMQTLEAFKLTQYRILSRELKQHMNNLLSHRAGANQTTLGMLDALEEKYEIELTQLKSRIEMLKPRPEGLPDYYVTPNDITMAKLQPIKNYLPNKIVNNKTLCLFHSDRTPSMQIYGNTYHCYSCNAHGDIIAIIQKLKNCSFTAAVKFLIGR